MDVWLDRGGHVRCHRRRHVRWHWGRYAWRSIGGHATEKEHVASHAHASLWRRHGPMKEDVAYGPFAGQREWRHRRRKRQREYISVHLIDLEQGSSIDLDHDIALKHAARRGRPAFFHLDHEEAAPLAHSC